MSPTIASNGRWSSSNFMETKTNIEILEKLQIKRELKEEIKITPELNILAPFRDITLIKKETKKREKPKAGKHMVDKDTSGMTTRDGKSIVSQSTQQSKRRSCGDPKQPNVGRYLTREAYDNMYIYVFS